MSEHFDCVGFGICAADYLCLVPKYPELDEKSEAVEFSKQGGGPCATGMVTLARLGFETAFIGKIGIDEDGDFVAKNFQRENINTTGLIRSSNMPTNKAFIWVDEQSGKKSIVLDSHQYQEVKPDELNLEFIESAKYLLIDGRDTDATFKMIDWAKRKNIAVVLDAGSPRQRMEELLKAVDYPILSRNFCIRYFSGLEVKDVLSKLLDFGCKAAVVTDGENGCVGADEDGIYSQPAFEVNVIDTTGAGDVFHGAFVAGLLQGFSLKENLKFSSLVAALKCERLGGQAGIPDMETVKQFERFYDV